MTSSVISFKDLILQSPALLKGLPKRLKGLIRVASQTDKTQGSLGLLLDDIAARCPAQEALVYQGRSWTYAELNRAVNRLANYLQNTGTAEGDVVAVFLENRPELMLSIAALSKLGAVSALVNTSQRGQVLAHSLDIVNAQRIILGQELAQALETLPEGRKVWTGESVFVSDSALAEAGEIPDGYIEFTAACEQQSEEPPLMRGAGFARDVMAYFYTSGTTGLPKAARMTNGRFMKAYAGVGLGGLQFNRDDRVHVCLPFYHATALAIGWGSILAGEATLVLSRKFSAGKFWQEIRENRVTAFCYVGELCRYLLGQSESKCDQEHHVRLMFGNGMRPGIWKAFKKRFGIKQVMEFYGSSEGNVGFINLFNLDATVGFTTVPYAIVHYDHDLENPVRAKDGFMRKVKKGEAGLLLGEITERSPFDGYTDANKTEGTILRNVFKHGDAWFNTGDLMLDQGYRHAQFVDRLGDTFRWKGENVSTAEVENILARESGVLDGVVYGVEIPGTNGRAGMAALRLKDAQRFDPVSIYQSLASQLPAYAVPVFLRLCESLQTTGTHKYQKTGLKREGFADEAITDALWVCLPKDKTYRPLTTEIKRAIQNGEYRF